jgi:hypothetical protein
MKEIAQAGINAGRRKLAATGKYCGKGKVCLCMLAKVLPVVLSLTLREDHRLRVFENRVLRRIFGPKRKVTGDWRKLHN